jgi:hypothetical protein
MAEKCGENLKLILTIVILFDAVEFGYAQFIARFGQSALGFGKPVQRRILISAGFVICPRFLFSKPVKIDRLAHLFRANHVFWAHDAIKCVRVH